MSIVSFIVLFAVIWFMTLMIMLPIGLRTQGEENDTVRGTPSSAPSNLRMGRKLAIVTLIAVPIWLGLSAIIEYDVVTVADLDWRGVLSR
ncbi:MAG: DUF1467 family protein [Paracoccaceae bacterium]